MNTEFYSLPIKTKAVQYTGDNWAEVNQIVSLNKGHSEICYVDKDRQRTPNGVITEFRALQLMVGPGQWLLVFKTDWIILNNDTGMFPIPHENFKRYYVPSAGEISNGSHTFDELYAHRIAIYLALCNAIASDDEHSGLVWKSRIHSDGTSWDGWFLLGINKAAGEQITYHLPESNWNDCYFAESLEIAPPFDGHTPADVLERLKTL